MTNRLPVLFLGHGSPMTAITDNPARRSFIELGKRLPRPEAILSISAHWETRGQSHLTIGNHPRTIHDFGDFPPALFAIQYPAPGSAALVERVAGLLGEDRISRDETWGFDHGTWGVLQPMYPECDVPTVALSLDRAIGAEDHLALGRKLAPLRDEGVLIVGSGNIVHNLALFRQLQGTEPEWARHFADRIN
ncbi:MAG: class III extradiol ring-cleavage dioxygenase, partial [Novosphingobium sp.]